VSCFHVSRGLGQNASECVDLGRRLIGLEPGPIPNQIPEGEFPEGGSRRGFNPRRGFRPAPESVITVTRSLNILLTVLLNKQINFALEINCLKIYSDVIPEAIQIWGVSIRFGDDDVYVMMSYGRNQMLEKNATNRKLIELTLQTTPFIQHNL